MIDHDKEPSGWWRVERDETGVAWVAIFHYGDDYSEHGPFGTKLAATRYTWQGKHDRVKVRKP